MEEALNTLRDQYNKLLEERNELQRTLDIERAVIQDHETSISELKSDYADLSARQKKNDEMISEITQEFLSLKKGSMSASGHGQPVFRMISPVKDADFQPPLKIGSVEPPKWTEHFA